MRRALSLILIAILPGLTLARRAFAADPDRIIFDTDCAFFNDDGAALVMLLQHPELTDVVGVTIVPGNMLPEPGAEAMFRILDVMHRGSIPLSIGARNPLVHTRAMAEQENQRWGPIEYLGAFGVDTAQQTKKLNRSTVRRVSSRNGVDYIIETLDGATVPVTILEIGPMTNLAIALRLRPDLEKKIYRLVFMGGATHVRGPDGRAAEFNFWFDPEAAQIVLRSAIPQKIMFGLDICDRVVIDKARYDQIASIKTPVTALYRQDLEKRFEKDPNYRTHVWDCLAAAYLVDSSFITKHESAYLDVETAFGKDYGAVKPLDRAFAPDATAVEVMTDLNVDKFFELYKSLLTKAP